MPQLTLFVTLGILGIFLRYGITHFFENSLPWTTFYINVIGSFSIGIVYSLSLQYENNLWTHALMIGFLGAFTTYSSFALDSLKLIEAGRWFMAFVYMGVTQLAGFIFCYLGFFLARYLIGLRSIT